MAPDFVGEVIARLQRLAEGGKIAVLHRQQRHLFFAKIGRLVEIAVLPHLAQHIVAPLGHAGLGSDGMILAGGLRHCGQHRRLMRGQVCQRLVEIGLGGRGNAVGILAQEDFVQIKLKDFFLVQRLFNARGKNDFLDLALAGAFAAQKEVLHHLLRDGRGTPHVLAARDDRIARRSGNAGHIIAFVLIEILVLGADEGFLHQIGNVLDGREQTPFFGEFIDDPPFAGIDPADRGRGILRQAFMAGQVAAIHPEDRPHRQGSKKQAQCQGCEDRSEKRPDEPDHCTLPPACASYTEEAARGQNPSA